MVVLYGTCNCNVLTLIPLHGVQCSYLLPMTVYATQATPTLQLIRLPSSPVTQVTIVTAVDGGVIADVMDPTPRKSSH